MRRTALLALALLPLLAAAACGGAGDDVAQDPAAGPTTASSSAPAAPTGIPVATGPVRTRGLVTVMDTGSPEVCLGAVAESWPPQCGGPPITNWDWATFGELHEEQTGTRWGSYALTGTWDGTALTVTESVPAALYDAMTPEPGPMVDDQFAPACPEPAGGWPDVSVTQKQLEAVTRVASEVPGYAGLWITMRDPRSPEKLDADLAEAAPDKAEMVAPVVNVLVTGDPAEAEARLREAWPGPLCVAKAERSEADLQRIADELTAVPGMLSTVPDVRRAAVVLDVVYDDGSLQAWAEEEYGAGVVDVVSQLVEAS
jgi:hypothetical protein